MPTIWAIADLHLSFGVPDKEMSVFGPQWANHAQQIETHWRACISQDDLVLIAGDISWALHIEEARPDLEWVGQLPGTKVLLRGNHDYWWQSLSKIKPVLPPSCHLIQNNSYTWNDVSIGGTRLWDTAEYGFRDYIDYQDNPRAKPLTQKDDSQDVERIFQRELGRLETSLRALDKKAEKRMIMTHYPPISAELKDSRVSGLLEKYKVDVCVFGHLHNVKKDRAMFGTYHGVQYYLTAADYLDFKPLKIC